MRHGLNAGSGAMAAATTGREPRHDGLTFFAVDLFRKRDDSSGPAADAGGCPEPAMDGRRPDVVAGRGDIRLGIPLWPRRAARAPPVLWLWLRASRASAALRARLELRQSGENPEKSRVST